MVFRAFLNCFIYFMNIKRLNYLIVVLFIIRFSFTAIAQNPAEGIIVNDTLLRTQWDQYSDNPLLTSDPSGWNKGLLYSPMVIMFKDTLRMWYMGSTAYGFSGIIHIGYQPSHRLPRDRQRA